MSSKAPRPLVSSRLTLENFVFETVPELELARQLTIMDFEKFRNIQPRECLNQAWSKKDKNTRAPNIVAMTEQWNKVSCWVQYQVLMQDDITKRATAYKKFIKLAEQCRELNNFHSMYAIYCGLTAIPVNRLHRTKEIIPEKLNKKMIEFQELFKPVPNFSTFRKVLRTTLNPCIPHIGLFLQDLTFTEDGVPDLTGDMINFQKRCKLAERIRWIKQYQQESYQLEQVAVVRDYFNANLRIYDSETLWRRSKEIEPSTTN